jgi:hypothetical protein
MGEITMDRERLIASALVDLVTALSATETDDVLSALCEHLAMALEANDAGILLGELTRPEFLGMSAPYVRDLLHGASNTLTDDGLAAGIEELGRSTIDLMASGSACGDVGRSAGIRWVQLLPLRAQGTVVGALAVLRDDRGPVPDDDLLLAAAIGDVAATAVVQARATRSAVELSGQLQQALTSRVAIEQAKGIIAARAGVDVDKAFARIRKYARDHNLQLSRLAEDIVERRLWQDAEDALLRGPIG